MDGPEGDGGGAAVLLEAVQVPEDTDAALRNQEDDGKRIQQVKVWRTVESCGLQGQRGNTSHLFYTDLLSVCADDSSTCF